MDACGFDVFHHTHYVEIFPVEDRIDLCFLTAVEEVIDEYLVVGKVFEQTYYGAFQLIIVDYNTHSLSAEHV